MTVDRTWQLSLRDLTMGADTAYRLQTAPEGLGVAPMRTNDMAWLAQDGAYGAGDWLQPRLVRAMLWVDGGTAAASEDLARTLAAAWAPSRVDLPLYVRVAAAQDYVLWGRPRRCEVNLASLKYGHAVAAVEFAALDPYLYAATQVTGTIRLGSGSTTLGVTPNLTFNLAFQPAGTSGPGVAYLGNMGTAPTALDVVLAGPVVTPRLENRTTGETFTMNATLLAGDTAVVDMAARTITINGTPRLDTLALGASWLTLQPGANEVAYRSADAIPPASTATVSWRHAWY